VIRRPRRVVPATAIALAIVALCVVVSVSLIQKLSGTKELVSYRSVAGWLHERTWSDGLIFGIGIAAAALGLVLVMVALVPGRAVVVPLESGDQADVGIARRSLRGAVRAAADSVDGVDSSRVRVGRRKIRVRARGSHGAAGDIGDSLNTAVQERLVTIAPRNPPQVAVRVRTAKSEAMS